MHFVAPGWQHNANHHFVVAFRHFRDASRYFTFNALTVDTILTGNNKSGIT